MHVLGKAEDWKTEDEEGNAVPFLKEAVVGGLDKYPMLLPVGLAAGAKSKEIMGTSGQ